MSERPRLLNMLRFRAPKGPGFGISRGYYLSVLAGTAHLPVMKEVATPKGDNGSVAGFGVPLGAEATKEDLGKPLARGAYAIASPDQKTVVKLLVLCKEEAGYDPEAFLATADALDLDQETRERLLATWSLLQLTFESFDPAVIPAVKFFLSIADRLAELTNGVVADPISQAYRLPGQLLTPTIKPTDLHARDVVTVKARIGNGTISLFTLGWQKFGLPEIELNDVPEGKCKVGIHLLACLNQNILGGTLLEVGDRVAEDAFPLRVGEGGLDAAIWKGIPCLELFPDRGTVADVLRVWEEKHYAHQ